ILGLAVSSVQAVPIWLAFAVVLASRAQASGKETWPDRIFRLALESPAPQWIGKRSYSIYILHSPMLVFICWALLRFAPLGRLEAFALIGAAVLVATLALSAVTYRWIEAPMIALGRKLALRHPAPAISADVAIPKLAAAPV